VNPVGIGVVKDGVFELLDLRFDLVVLKMRLKLGEIVDGALAVGRCDNVLGILPDVLRDFSPRSFDC
jgi:hypothetical protein